MTSAAAKPKQEITAVANRTSDGEISVHAWNAFGLTGIATQFYITPERAEKLIVDLRAAIDAAPRVADAADLGIAA